MGSSPLSVAPGLDLVLSSNTPPSIEFFKQLPRPSTTIKQWGIYAIVIERPGEPPKLYIGSDTSADGGIQRRVNSYLADTAKLPRFVDIEITKAKALDKDYTITSIGMLCWNDLPEAHLVPRYRARMLVLEPALTIVFCASIKTIMDELFIPDFFLWQRDQATWKPLCSHLSLSEAVRADLSLTPEELTVAAAARKERELEKSRRHRKRKRDEDAEAYLQNGRDQAAAFKTKNPERVLEIAADVGKKAKDAQRFRCDTCDHNAATQFTLDQHCKSKAHRDAVKNGGKVEKPLSEPALAKRASRAAAIENKSFYCSTCDKACTSSADLKRHNEKQKHKDAVEKERKAAAATS